MIPSCSPQHKCGKPALKSSGNYASVSSASFNIHLVVSLNFTLLFSTMDESSMPSAIFDHKSCDKSKMIPFPPSSRSFNRDPQVKGSRGLGEPQDENRIIIKDCPLIGTKEVEKARWKKAIKDHEW